MDKNKQTYQNIHHLAETVSLGKGKLVGTLFNASRGAISFSLAIGPDYSMYNITTKSHQSSAQQACLPSRPKLVPIYTPGSRGAS